MEFILGFFAGALTSWWVLPFLIFGALWAESSENGFMAGLLSILVGIGLFLLYPVAWATVGYAALAYLPIGFVWSFWRYRKHVRNGLKRGVAKVHLEPNSCVSSIVYWVIFWPISFIESIFSDFFDFVRHIVTSWLNRAYTAIFKAATKGLDTED